MSTRFTRKTSFNDLIISFLGNGQGKFTLAGGATEDVNKVFFHCISPICLLSIKVPRST